MDSVWHTEITSNSLAGLARTSLGMVRCIMVAATGDSDHNGFGAPCQICAGESLGLRSS